MRQIVDMYIEKWFTLGVYKNCDRKEKDPQEIQV